MNSEEARARRGSGRAERPRGEEVACGARQAARVARSAG